MCGRFININKVKNIENLFNIKNINNINYSISFNICPEQKSLIITNKNFLTIEIAKWGISFIDKRDSLKKNIINSRSETIQKKIIFKDSYKKRKCLIPANGYYEWKKINNKKIPYFIHQPYLDSMFFAGIWNFQSVNNLQLKVFSIITKSAHSNLKHIHDRMPFILSFDEGIEYLENNNQDFIDIEFKSNFHDNLTYFEVSNFVNNPSNNSKECINPLN